MAFPWFSIVGLTLIAVLAIIAVGASVVVCRASSLAEPYRAGLIAAITAVAAAGILWIFFVAPVYVD